MLLSLIRNNKSTAIKQFSTLVEKRGVNNKSVILPNSSIATSAKIDSSDSTSIWNYVQVGGNAKIEEKVSLGDFVKIGENARVGMETVLESHVRLAKNVQVGNNVVIGAGSVIEEGVTIPSNVKIPAGSKVTVGNVKTFPFGVPGPVILEVERIAAKAKSVLNEWESLIDHDESFTKMPHSSNNLDHRTWATFLNIDSNPEKHPERRGLIYDKNET